MLKICFFVSISLSPFPPPISTVESSIGRAPLQEDSYGENSAKIYSTYEPSSQVKYSPDKYLIAEKIQSALRQPPAYAQVCNQIILLLLFIYIYF